ncbi:MAG: ice-binding family protein [Candidatus Marinimicrobia bacterium]|nr:ice-binding family protein [Candidatus Neomarinimicrobiota bacterium]
MKKQLLVHSIAPSRSGSLHAAWIKGAITLLLPLSVVFAQSLQPVNLGSTADFAILAGSLVSNIPTSAITGDIGLSPATGGNIIGFGPNEVTGTIYTTDVSGPAGSVPAASMLATAQGDITIAYNDAFGRTPIPTGPFLNPGAGDIAGLTLVAGLYKFTSGTLVSITGADVTLTGSETDVWIFQIASSLTVGNGTHVILAGGAQAANIFWQVGSSATLGTTCDFKGTIIADQSIDLNTGATVEGRLLAHIGAVTMASSSVTVPGLEPTGVDAEMLPDGFNLSQNFPNPFNPSTTISYQLPANGQVSLTITDMLGREVSVLVNDVQVAGHHQIVWDAQNVASGTYIYRLEAGSHVSVKQLVLLK